MDPIALFRDEVSRNVCGIGQDETFLELSNQWNQAAINEAKRRNPVAYRITPYGLNLPSALCLTREHVTQVCEA